MFRQSTAFCLPRNDADKFREKAREDDFVKRLTNCLSVLFAAYFVLVLVLDLLDGDKIEHDLLNLLGTELRADGMRLLIWASNLI